jgi:hypothetical protein
MGCVARTEPGETQNGVTDIKFVDAGTEGSHKSCEVTPLSRRKSGREPLCQRAGPDRRLTGVYSSRLDCDDNLTSRRGGQRHIGNVENIPSAISVEAHRS